MSRKNKGEQMSSREKILKYCKVEREPNLMGNVLVYGPRRYRMNLLLDDMTDAQLNKVVGYMRLDAYIREAEERTSRKRGAVANLDSRPCECGCERMTRRGSRFLPGHDAKLKSALRKAADDGNAGAKKELESRGWARANT